MCASVSFANMFGNQSVHVHPSLLAGRFASAYPWSTPVLGVPEAPALSLFGQHSMLHHIDRPAEGAECGNIVGDKQDAGGFPLLLQKLQQKRSIFRVQRRGGLIG